MYVLLSGNCLIPKTEVKTHSDEERRSEKTEQRHSHCTCLWSRNEGWNMRVPIHEEIWARLFLLKGPLLVGWTVSSPHVPSPEVSASFLNWADRSGKYPGSEAVYVISTLEGPISRKTLQGATGGNAIVLASQLGGLLYLLWNFLQT